MSRPERTPSADSFIMRNAASSHQLDSDTTTRTETRILAVFHPWVQMRPADERSCLSQRTWLHGHLWPDHSCIVLMVVILNATDLFKDRCSPTIKAWDFYEPTCWTPCSWSTAMDKKRVGQYLSERAKLKNGVSGNEQLSSSQFNTHNDRILSLKELLSLSNNWNCLIHL